MSAFPRLRPPGFWVASSVVDQAEFEAIDDGRSKSLNAADGGVWANSSPISIGGAWVFAGGASVDVQSGVTATFESGSFLSFVSGSLFTGTATTNAGFLFDVFGGIKLDGAAAFLSVVGGGLITVQTGGTVLIGNGAALTLTGTGAMTASTSTSVTLGGTSKFSSTGTLEIDCHTTIDTTRILTFAGTSEAAFSSGAFISGNPTLKGGALFTIASGGTVITWSTGAILNTDSGSTAQFSGGFKVAPGGGGDVTDITMSSNANIKLAGRTILRMNELMPFNPPGGSGSVWQLNGDGSATVTATVNPLSGLNPSMYIPLHVPNGCTLASVVTLIHPGSGHSAFPGGAPANMPTLQVFKTQAGTSTQIGTTTTDASATAGAFQSAHILTVSLSEVVDRTLKRYYAVLTSELGTNALPGTVLIDVFVSYAADHYDED